MPGPHTLIGDLRQRARDVLVTPPLAYDPAVRPVQLTLAGARFGCIISSRPMCARMR
jgi:hypothetical protein